MLGVRTPFQLSSRIPVFPLTGTVLMPFGHLPLNIFEPRYVNLIDDTLGSAGTARMFGMVQPRTAHTGSVPDDAELYSIGTIGRIIQFNDPGDGHYLITLQGITRFRILHTELPHPDRGYRWVQANFKEFEDDLNPTERNDGPGRTRILELMRGYFGDKDIEADWDAVSEAPYEALVASLAMSCPFEPEEKQALLECKNQEERAHMLISLFEMSNMDNTLDAGLLKH